MNCYAKAWNLTYRHEKNQHEINKLGLAYYVLSTGREAEFCSARAELEMNADFSEFSNAMKLCCDDLEKNLPQNQSVIMKSRTS